MARSESAEVRRQDVMSQLFGKKLQLMSDVRHSLTGIAKS